MADSRVATRAITADDADSVSAFLHEHLNRDVPADEWRKLILPPWAHRGPNHGFQLATDDGTLVGVYAAVYSSRDTASGPVAVCNLAAFCVLEGYRAHGLRLVRALLGQRDLVFTDLSPSGNVVAMNERLGFRRLDTATRLLVNLPRPGPRRVRLTSDPAAIERVLAGRDAAIYRDHRDAPVEHLVVQRDGAYAYLIYRRDRRKGLRLFATPLYAGGSAACLRAGWGAIQSRLLRQGLVFTLAERRILGPLGGLGFRQRSPRAKMLRGEGIAADDIDYLYSELTLVEW